MVDSWAVYLVDELVGPSAVVLAALLAVSKAVATVVPWAVWMAGQLVVWMAASMADLWVV